jgi:hypothetical protein
VIKNLLRRTAAIGFIVLTVVFWWILSQGAASVIKAYERRFDKPVASSTTGPATPATTEAGTPAPPPKVPSTNWSLERFRDLLILVTTLLAAMWAAARFVFPPEDFAPPAKRVA